MRLYKINEQMRALFDQLEDGAAPDDIIAQIEALDMQRDEVLRWVAKEALNARADADALKAEEQRLKQRREAAEAKRQRLIDVLARECAGQRTDLGVATVCFRASPRVEISDPGQALKWLEDHGRDDAVKYLAPEISKTALRDIIKGGEIVPGAQMVSDTSCYLR